LHQVGDLFEFNVKFRCQKVYQSNTLPVYPITYPTNHTHRTVRQNFYSRNWNYS